MKWNSELYDQKHSFVSAFGQGLLPLLNAQPQEYILDLGCGTGDLTQEIASTGAVVKGIDPSAEMITTALAKYPELDFEIADARSITFRKESFDAVFSNAVLHWIPEKDLVAKNVFESLKPGGRFVAEFGGKDNVLQMLTTLKSILLRRGFKDQSQIDFWYFPSIAGYAKTLEDQGFRTLFASHYDRETPLEGPDGMKNWFKMFSKNFFKDMGTEAIESVLDEVQETLKPTHFREGTWFADYKRIRIIAQKP